MQKRAVILGHGYVAGHLTRQLVRRGWQVHGTTRSRHKAVAASGAIAVDWADAGALIGAADMVLASAGPDVGPDGAAGRTRDPALRDFGAEIAARAAQGGLWLGYLSSTNVYGDHQGGWVDEDTPLAPTTSRGQARAAAEAEWQNLCRDVHIFRLAGIYGPGRGPFAKLRAGTARRIIKPGQVFSRIHVDDIVQAILAALDRPCPGVYNLCDDCPAPPEDVIAEGARLLGLPLPPAEDFDTAPQSVAARMFYAENKRVSNRRVKERLNLRLIHPDYRAGLRAVLAAEEGIDPAERG